MATQDVSLALTPSELLLRLPRRAGTFLLDGGSESSWGCGEAVLGCEPTMVASCRADGQVCIRDAGGNRTTNGHPLHLLDRLLAAPAAPATGGRAPMEGLLCAFAYDLGRWIERLTPGPPDDSHAPIMFLASHPWVLVYSYGERRYTLRSRRLSRRQLDPIARRLERVARTAAPAGLLRGAPRSATSNLTREEYLRRVRHALSYIAAGDVYQVNLSQRFSAPSPGAPAALFRALLERHPAPYGAYVDCGDRALVSNSPECFLERSGDRVGTFPIKGTRGRGITPRQDAALAAELAASDKERAEHVMIVDLERNDLGRVCRPSTVNVRELARVRSFPSLFHLESEVRGRLRPGVTASELLRATFPGGSITGAPKIRAMEIIDELEPVARRFYTGAIGLADGNEWMKLNIAIRTAVVARDTVTYHAGGGIVADSVPEDEYDETLLKARAFLETLRSEAA